MEKKLTTKTLERFINESDPSIRKSREDDSLTSSSGSSARSNALSIMDLGEADHSRSAPMTRSIAQMDHGNGSYTLTSSSASDKSYFTRTITTNRIDSASQDRDVLGFNAKKVDFKANNLGQRYELADPLLPGVPAKKKGRSRCTKILIWVIVGLVVVGAVVVRIVTLLIQPESPWVAILSGHLDGIDKKYNFPCDHGSLDCVYSFDSNSAIEISFDGTENLTDSKGHPLTSPWIWNSSHDVGVHSLTTNQSLRVDNDPLRAFEIVVHQQHKPAPSKHPHPSPSKPGPSVPSPSPSKPPSPAPMVQPPYCEIYLDGRLFAVHVNSTPMVLTDLAINSSNLSRVEYPPFGVFDPQRSVVAVDCYEGADYSLNGSRPVVNGTFSPGYELLNFSFGNGVGVNRSSWLYQFTDLTNAMATVVFDISYKGQLSQETLAAGWQNHYLSDYDHLIPNSTLSINGASPNSMVYCYRNSRCFNSGRNLAVLIEGTNDEFSCTIQAPYVDPLSLTFGSLDSTPAGIVLPVRGGVCSIFNGGLLVNAIASANKAPDPDPLASPSDIYVLPDSDVVIECSSGVKCSASPSPSWFLDSTDYYDRSPKESFNYAIGKYPLSISCFGSYSNMDFNLVSYARVAGFYRYSGYNPSWDEWVSLSFLIYDGDNGEKNIAQVTWYTLVIAKFVGDVYAMCSQDGSTFFQGNPVVFNASDKGVYTKCQLMSRTNFVSASLWFKSVAPPNATRTSASKAGLFSGLGRNRSVMAENFANAMVP